MTVEKRAIRRRVLIDTRRVNGDDVPAISGYGAVFYREDEPETEFRLWDDMVERIAPTAFDEIEGRDVRSMFNHEPDLLLGRTTNGTLELSVDDIGLRYRVTPPDTQAGRDVRELVRRGDVDGSSFMFEVTGEEFEKRDGVVYRTITRVNLYEVGPVTFPAYEATTSEARANRPNVPQLFEPGELSVKRKRLYLLS